MLITGRFFAAAQLRSSLQGPRQHRQGPICIHRAPLGTHGVSSKLFNQALRRQFHFLVSPVVKVRILTISDDRS
jgi:hypothetical protein